MSEFSITVDWHDGRRYVFNDLTETLLSIIGLRDGIAIVDSDKLHRPVSSSTNPAQEVYGR